MANAIGASIYSQIISGARREPLKDSEVGQVLVEVSAARTPLLRSNMLARLERSGLVEQSQMEALRSRLSLFVGPVSERGLQRFTGSIGLDQDGNPIYPNEFRFKGIPAGGDVVYVSDQFETVARRILNEAEGDYASYFSGRFKNLGKTLALAEVVLDHDAELLKITEEQRVLFLWELLARADYEFGMNGKADDRSKQACVGATDWELYTRLRTEIKEQGLEPMAQRALDIRDGRDKPFAVFAGQGAGYINELNFLIENYPEAKKLYGELKDLFVRHGIDIEKLRRMADADQKIYANYIEISRVSHAFPMINLVQALRVRVMELHGYDFGQFVALLGQSGGLPAAYFAAGSFDAEGYTPPLVPKNDGDFRGYHTLQAYQNFMEWSIAEGKVFEGPFHANAEGATEFEPLVKMDGEGKKIPPKPADVDAYFQKYNLVTMTVSGIPYDWFNPGESDLGQLVEAINTRYAGTADYVEVNNVNTDETKDGSRSHFILMIGHGRALADLAKMIIFKRDFDWTGYDDAVVARLRPVVTSFSWDPNVRDPLIQTGLTMPPHNPRVYADAPREHEELLAHANHYQPGTSLRLRTPYLSTVLHNNRLTPITFTDDALDLDLRRQQWHWPVNMPHQYRWAASHGATSALTVGPSSHHAKTALPAVFSNKRMDILGVVDEDADGVKSWIRTTTTDPLKAHLQTVPKVKKTTDDSAVGKLKAIDGVQVDAKKADGSDDYLTVRVAPIKRLDEKSDGTKPSVFEQYKNGILGIDPDSVITDFLKAKKLTVDGKPENNPYPGFIRNVPEKDKTRHEIEFKFEDGKVKTINFYENGRVSFAVTNRGDGGIHMVQYYYPNPSDLTARYELNRDYNKVGAAWEQAHMTEFRREARSFYRQIWNIPTEWANVSVEDAARGGAVFERRSAPLTARQATDYAASVGSTETKYTDATSRNFEVHPHYLSHDMWQSLDAAMFLEAFDMDPTRVIDEGKTFNFVAPIRVGDTLVTRSRLLKAEDFNDGRLAGRRVVVRAEVYRVKGGTEELVRIIDSSLVSRMRTGPERVIFSAVDADTAINLLEGRTVYSNVANPAQTIDRLAIEGYQKDLKTEIDEWNEDLKEKPSPKRIPYFDGAKVNDASAAFMGKYAAAIEALAKLIKKAEEGDADAKGKVEPEQKRLGDLLKAAYKKLGVVASKYLAERLSYLPQSQLVFKGSLVIPVDLAEKYVVDLNPIHVSDLAAVAGGIQQGRIMQGMATFAHVNEFILNEMQRAGLVRDALGVANLKYTGFVGMGDKLFPEVTRTATAEGVDSYHVVVKNAQGSPVMNYDLVGKGVKTALVFTGQGSQYLDMGNHLISDPARRARLAQFQEYMPHISASARSIQAALVKALKSYKYTASTKAEVKIAGQARVMPVLYRALLEADAVQRHQPLLDAIDSLGTYIDAEKRDALKALVSAIGLSPDDKKPIVDLVKSMNSKAGKADKTEDDTSKVQPMIMAYSLILFEEMKAKGLIPRDAAYAGHSLGMWITLVASGMLSPDEAMKAVYERGASQVRYIDTERPQTLVAVFPTGDGIEPLSEAQMIAIQEYVRGQCAEMGIEPPFVIEFSNDNSPKQWMIGGHKALFDKNPTTNPEYYRLAESVWNLFGQFGYTLNIRPIANAFHTSLMEMASADFLAYMRRNGIPFDPAKLDQAVDVYLDVEAKSLREIGRENGIAEDDFSSVAHERRKQLLGDIMARQLARSVRWRANVRKMLEEGVRRFIEIGPSHHQSAGTLKPFIEEEVKYLKANGIIKPDERIEIIYANSLKAFNTKEIGALTASAETAVVEVNRPDITVGEIKVERLADLQRGNADEVTDQPQALATVAPGGPALKTVTPAEVKAIVDAFVGANKPAIDARQNLEVLATQLSGKLVALGAGAADALKARQSELAAPPSGPVAAAPAGSGSLVDDVIVTMKQLGQIGASEAVEGGTRFKDDLGYDTNKINELRNAYQSRHSVTISDSEIEKISTVNQFAALLTKKGVKVGGGATTAASTITLSNEDKLIQKAIQTALTTVGTVESNVGAGSKPARAGLEPAPTPAPTTLAVAVAPSPRGVDAVDQRVGLDPKGAPTIYDSEQASRLVEAERRLGAVRASTSDFFVDSLMQPHYADSIYYRGTEGGSETIDPRKILRGDMSAEDVTGVLTGVRAGMGVYGFNHVTRNGGIARLMRFVGYVRSSSFETRIPEDATDTLRTSLLDQEERELRQIANGMDNTRLGWLRGFINAETKKRDATTDGAEQTRRQGRIDILERLYTLAAHRIEKGIIYTGQMIDIVSGNHVPTYGGSKKSQFVQDADGTLSAAKRLADPTIADKKTGKDLQLLLDDGYDLRGHVALVHQASTITAGYASKWMQLGGHVMMTDYAGRSAERKGRVASDLYYDIYSEAADGASMDIVPHMQPGNRFDEDALLYYIEMKYVADLKQYKEDKEKFKIGELEVEPQKPHLPTLYINGAGREDYGSLADRGTPLDSLLVMALSTRWIAISLAKLHQKYKTEEKVIFVNLYTPNNAANLGETEGELNPSALPGSKSYHLTKNALPPGQTAAEAFANGIVDEEGNPILVEVARTTGWGKSDGRSETLMSAKDYYSQPLETESLAEGIKIKTSTGDELSTIGLAGALAVKFGKRKMSVPAGDARKRVHGLWEYDDNYGFTAGLKTSKFGEIEARVKEAEDTQHAEAKIRKAEEKKAAVDPSLIPLDGTIVDLNHLNIAIKGDTTSRYVYNPKTDILFEDETPVVRGYGMVGPLGTDALANYRNMLAAGLFKGHEGYSWLGNYDFFNLAKAMGVDVSQWGDYKKLAASIGLDDTVLEKFKTWQNAVEAHLLANSGIQEVGRFKEFEVVRQVAFGDNDKEIEIENTAKGINLPPATRQKLQDAGLAIHRRPDGSLYALAKGGQTYFMKFTIQLPKTIAGDLPGQTNFDWEGMGVPADELRTGAKASFMAKMFTSQILMSAAGRSPKELDEVFGPKNVFVGIGTGLGDLEPFNEMTLKPMQIEDSVANYLMAALIPDATAGQVATEQLGAEGMALAVIAACSTGNMNIIMAVKHLFSEYWAATRREESGMDVNWDEVFAKIWIAGGVDYAITFNAIFGFDAIGATVRDSVRRGRDIAIKMASRPDDMERFGFVLGAGGGGQGITSLSNAIKTGDPVYSMIAGAEARTDGDKRAYKGAREGYGIGQRSALFDAWDQAKEKLTEVMHTPEAMTDIVQNLMRTVQKGRGTGREKAEFNATTAISTWGLKPTEQKALYNKLVERFGPKLTEEEWNTAVGESCTGKNLIDFLVDNTRKLKENVRLVVMAHKTSTPMGDLYEEESIRLFLSSILDPAQFAHIVKTKAHMGHLLGGSSGSDSALSPLVMRFLGIPGDPGLDNIHEAGGQNATIYHHKYAENLRDLYDEDITWAVIREAAGFNAKNTAIIEVMGKLGFETEESAIDYVAKLIEGVAKERVQKRAERQGLRKMFFNRATYQETPISLYRDQYEVTLRSQAIARALVLEGRKFDWNNITGWVYQFPLNEGVELEVDTDLAQNNFVNPRVYTVDFEKKKVKRLEVTGEQATATNKKANAEIIRSQHNAIKYAEAQARVKEIYDSIGADEVAEMGRLAREKAWDRRPMVFYGMSDGMGMRTLIALIKSGAVKEVVGVHRDPNPVDPAKPEELVEKSSSFNPAVLKALADTHGINLQLLNVNAVPFDVGHAAATGNPTPLPKEVVEAVGKAYEPTIAEMRGWLTRQASRTEGHPMLVKGEAKLEDLGLHRSRTWLHAVNEEFGTTLKWDDIKGLTLDALIKKDLLPGVNFFDSVAFGLPARAHYQPELSVPSMNSYGELEMKKIPNFASEKEEEIATIIPMGRSHPRLLDLFIEQGWLKAARGNFGASETFWFDWRGSESDGMLGGVYGGATWETKGSLGRAKMTTKKELATPRLSDPNTGLRRVLSFPAFLSFALHQIPGGTLAGLIEKRIFEDIQSGALVLPGVDVATTKFVSMNELSVRALMGALKGEFERGAYDQDIYVFVDKHEVSIYPEVARRIQEVQARLEARLGAEKAAWVAEGKSINEFENKMSREDTALLLADILPSDHLKYTFEHIGDIKEKRTLERSIKHDAEGIAQLPMPTAFKGVHYPVLQRGFSPEVNTPALAIAVIDAGGIGTLDAGNLKATETRPERVLRERAARRAAAEGGNGVNGVPDTLEARIDAVYADAGNTAPLVVSLDVSASNFVAQLKVVAEKQVRGVMFRGGLPKPEQVIALNKVGIAVFQTVDTAADVIKLTEMKVVENEGKPNQRTTKAKFAAVVAERSLSSGNVNQAGESKFGDLSDLRDPKWDTMPSVPLRPMNLQFKTTDFPPFTLRANKSEVDFKLPETYAGYTGITHGGMLDSIFESVLEAMIQGGEKINIHNLHRDVGYIANAPSNANVRIYVEKKPDGRIEMRMAELIDKPAEGVKPATREEKTLSNATFQDASKVKKKDTPSTINPAELASNAQFGCLPNCVAAGHQHDTGLHFRFNYDEGKKALWGKVTPIAGQSRYHSMMLAADELTGWSGMMAFKIWGFTADNLYTPLRAPGANEAITLVAEVPEWDGLTGDMRMKVTFFGEDNKAIGVLTARYVPQMKAAQNVLARAIENLRAHPEDPEIRATFAFVKKALGHNFNKILQAVEQDRDMNADPELIVRKAREALYDAKIPVVASGAYTTHEDVKGAFHWGASGVALDDAILYSKESQYGGKTILSHPREGGDPSGSVAVRIIEDAEGRKMRLMDTPGAQKLDAQLKLYRQQIKDKALTEAIAKPLMRTAVTNAFANAGSANDATRRQSGIFLASQNVGTVRVGEELESTFERLIHGTEAPPPPEPGRDTSGGPDGSGGTPAEPRSPDAPPSDQVPAVAARATGQLVSLADYATSLGRGLRPVAEVAGDGLVQGAVGAGLSRPFVGAQFIAPSEQGVIYHAPTQEAIIAGLGEHGYSADELEGLGLEATDWQQLAIALETDDPASAIDQVLEDVGMVDHADPAGRMQEIATRAGRMTRGSASPMVVAALKAG